MSLKAFIASQMRDKPTTAQLTSFAIALANRTGNHDPAALVKEALAIWEAANELLVKSEPPRPPKPIRQVPLHPEPTKFPVTLDKFLGLMLPSMDGRTGDKYDVFRQYLAYRRSEERPRPRLKCFDDGLDPVPPEPTEGDICQRLARWREVGIPDLPSYRCHASDFRAWYRSVYTPKAKSEASEAKADNAFKRHAKAKLREQLWRDSQLANPNTAVQPDKFPEVTEEQMARLLQINEGKPLKDYKDWNYQLGMTSAGTP